MTDHENDLQMQRELCVRLECARLECERKQRIAQIPEGGGQPVFRVWCEFHYYSDRRSRFEDENDEIWETFTDKNAACAFAEKFFDEKRREYRALASEHPRFYGNITVTVSEPFPTSPTESEEYGEYHDDLDLWLYSGDYVYDFIYSPLAECWEYDSDDDD